MPQINMETDIINSTRFDTGRITYERPTADITSSVRILTVVVRLANAHGWDVPQLAETADIPNELVWRLLDGNAALNTDDTARFAKAFDMSPLEIYEAAEKVVLADTDEQDTPDDADEQDAAGPWYVPAFLDEVKALESELGSRNKAIAEGLSRHHARETELLDELAREHMLLSVYVGASEAVTGRAA